jgi:glutamate/tyrosine decarboxylase-like PLP-dependent enzyme
MAVDDFAAITAIRDRLVTDYGLKYVPHVHADAVLGWAYLTFLDYDFTTNPFRLSDAVISKLLKLSSRLRTLRYADSLGVDFHKTGFTPYTSSIIMVSDREDLALLRRDERDMAPLFHEVGAYNPGKYSLETSRSTANMVATWLTMITLGKDGLRRLLAHALENAARVRQRIAEIGNSEMSVVNRQSYGPDVFVRYYPPGKTPCSLDLEIGSPASIESGNQYNSAFFEWLTSSARMPRPFAGSKTSAAFYAPSGKPVVAIRVYSLNPNMTGEHADQLPGLLLAAKREFDRCRK